MEGPSAEKPEAAKEDKVMAGEEKKEVFKSIG